MSDKKQLQDLKQQLSRHQRSRGAHKGDPDALRDHKEREQELKDQIEKLKH